MVKIGIKGEFKIMKRMKTFLMYALIIIGFMFLSHVLEDGLLLGMYDKIDGKADKGAYTAIQITDVNGRACNINGYLFFKVKNESNSPVNCYGKLDLYSKQKLLAATESDYISKESIINLLEEARKDCKTL